MLIRNHVQTVQENWIFGLNLQTFVLEVPEQWSKQSAILLCNIPNRLHSRVQFKSLNTAYVQPIHEWGKDSWGTEI